MRVEQKRSNPNGAGVLRLVALALGLLGAADLWARAGGAGGGHASSSHGGGYSGGSGGGGDIGFLFEIIFWLVRFLLGAGPVGWIVFAIVVVAVVAFLKSQVSNFGGGDVSEGPTDFSSDAFDALIGNKREGQSPGHAGVPQEVEMDPAERQRLFEKTKLAFLTIQTCWSNRQLKPMRRFISDGVYQRFFAQFFMMKKLELTNPIVDVEVISIAVVRKSIDGMYESVDVKIEAQATDQFISEKYPNLNSPGGTENFTEYWTFIRRTNHVAGKDIFHSQNCPQCSAPLDDRLLQSARCEFCGCSLNSGEFDWVLSEITQEEEYPSGGLSAITDGDIQMREQTVSQSAPFYSRHQVEDRASNAYLQILIADASRQPKTLARFTTETCFAALNKKFSRSNLVYDRLYLGTSEVLRLRVEFKYLRVDVGVTAHFRRIAIEGGRASLETENLQQETRVISLIREMGSFSSKGSVYANTCSACGGSQKDILSPVCEYCAAVLNDPKLDWIVDRVMTVGEYQAQTA